MATSGGASEISESGDRRGALTNVRVLDLGVERAGSVCTMLLADLGADVVRVEARDGTHQRPAPLEAVDGVCWDRGKRRVVVDRLDPADDDALARLVANADVIVVDGGPAQLRVHGLNANELASHNRRAVTAWLPANGTHGPLADLPANPLLLSAITSYAQAQTSIANVPIAPVVPFVSNIHGALGAAAIVAALIERQTSNVGQMVTVTGLHASALMLTTLTGKPLDQPLAYSPGRDSRRSPFFRLYQGGDGEWFFLGALVPSIFLSTLDAIDMMEVMVLPGIDGEFMNLYVGDNGQQVAHALERRFRERPRQHWLDVLASAGVPAAAVDTRQRWQSSPAFDAVGGRVERAHPALGTVMVPNTPIKMGTTPTNVGALADPNASWPSDAIWSDTAPSPSIERERVRTDAPIHGLKVLDFSTFLAGPMGPMLLGHWGAEVIKVESPAGDPYRLYNVAYTAVNQGKRRVVLDLNTEQGQIDMRALAKDADIVVDNFRPSLRAKLGFTTDALHAINPGLVHATLNAFGDHGPMAESPGFDPIVQACSGLMDACGEDGQPYSTSTPVHDIATGSLITLGALAAIYARPTIGRGQRVSVSLASSTLLVQCEELTEYAGRPPAERGGTDFVGRSPTRRYYRARDGWIAIATEAHLLDELVAWAGEATALHTREEAGEAIAAAVAVRAADETVDALLALGIVATRVIEPDEHALHPHIASHQVLHAVHDPEIGRCLVVDQIATWSRSRPIDTTTSPPRDPETPAWRTPIAPRDHDAEDGTSRATRG